MKRLSSSESQADSSPIEIQEYFITKEYLPGHIYRTPAKQGRHGTFWFCRDVTVNCGMELRLLTMGNALSFFLIGKIEFHIQMKFKTKE